MQCGLFSYEPGYRLVRESFDSFLLMYIRKGELDLSFEGKKTHAASGSFILLDCYKKHGYSSATGCECLWCHFDGPVARAYYTCVTSRIGNVFPFRILILFCGKCPVFSRFFITAVS